MLFRERLTVPWTWWGLAALAALTMLLAVGFYLGPIWGAGVALGVAAIAGAVFVSAAITISVDGSAVRVGRSLIEGAYLGEVTSLDGEQAARLAGVEADVRAHLVLRPYISTAVQIMLDDAADPVPYWLVSTRRPVELAAALRTAAAPGVAG
jgi:hypothetical protein